MTHHKKIYPEYFQAVIEGRKPFEIRENDENYQPGERVLLKEYTERVKVPGCPDRDWCRKGWHSEPEGNDYFEFPEECAGRLCDGYTKELYTGRKCLVKIKEVFELDKAGLPGYVAFTFDILHITDKGIELK